MSRCGWNVSFVGPKYVMLADLFIRQRHLVAIGCHSPAEGGDAAGPIRNPIPSNSGQGTKIYD